VSLKVERREHRGNECYESRSVLLFKTPGKNYDPSYPTARMVLGMLLLVTRVHYIAVHSYRNVQQPYVRKCTMSSVFRNDQKKSRFVLFDRCMMCRCLCVLYV
jgi:hypothetical protein